jgi:hypothetical protein
MEVVKTAGTNDQIAISAITKITFTTTDMTVGGAGKTYPINTIQVILFHNIDAAIESPNAKSGLFSFENLGPNPFRPSTGIRFGLLRDSDVRITVLSASGAKVRELLKSHLKPGNFEVAWNGTDTNDKPVAAGSYIVNLTLNGRTISKKAILLK